jgi:hypothetical protein
MQVHLKKKYSDFSNKYNTVFITDLTLLHVSPLFIGYNKALKPTKTEVRTPRILPLLRARNNVRPKHVAVLNLQKRQCYACWKNPRIY